MTKTATNVCHEHPLVLRPLHLQLAAAVVAIAQGAPRFSMTTPEAPSCSTEVEMHTPSLPNGIDDSVFGELQALREEVAPILAIVTDAGRVAELKAERCFNQAYLQQQLNISAQHVEVLYRYAKCMYECGDYQTASGLLAHYRQLT